MDGPQDAEPEPTGLSRTGRLLEAAADKGIPLRTILTVDAVVILTWLAYRLVGRLREVILWILTAAFVALVLNPAVNFLQRHRFRRGPQWVSSSPSPSLRSRGCWDCSVTRW